MFSVTGSPPAWLRDHLALLKAVTLSLDKQL
jgi:hypothetical protein